LQNKIEKRIIKNKYVKGKKGKGKKKVPQLHEQDYPCVSSIVQNVTQFPQGFREARWSPYRMAKHLASQRKDEIIENPTSISVDIIIVVCHEELGRTPIGRV